jgi:hypothetical protein
VEKVIRHRFVTSALQPADNEGNYGGIVELLTHKWVSFSPEKVELAIDDDGLDFSMMEI